MLLNFFSLSPEVRNAIYEPLVVSNYVVKCAGFDPVRHPPVTQVCRRMRAEALSLYYSENEFELANAIYPNDSSRVFAIKEGNVGVHEPPSAQNSPTGVLGHWIQKIGLAQFRYVQRLVIPINDQHPEALDEFGEVEWYSNHRARVIIDFPEGEKVWGDAQIEVEMMEGIKTFRQDVKKGVSGQGCFGSMWGDSKTRPLPKGCAPFNHVLNRWLSWEEPEIDGRRQVYVAYAHDDPRVTDDSGKQLRLWRPAEAEGHEIAETIDNELWDQTVNILKPPPTRFFPSSDVFTVLSILADAEQFHDCCYMREPPTSGPMKLPGQQRLDFDGDQFIKYTADDFVNPNGNQMWDVFMEKKAARDKSEGKAEAVDKEEAEGEEETKDNEDEADESEDEDSDENSDAEFSTSAEYYEEAKRKEAVYNAREVAVKDLWYERERQLRALTLVGQDYWKQHDKATRVFYVEAGKGCMERIKMGFDFYPVWKEAREKAGQKVCHYHGNLWEWEKVLLNFQGYCRLR